MSLTPLEEEDYQEHYFSKMITLVEQQEQIYSSFIDDFSQEEKEIQEKISQLYEKKKLLLDLNREHLKSREAFEPWIRGLQYFSGVSSLAYGALSLEAYPITSAIWITSGLLGLAHQVALDWSLYDNLPLPLKEIVPYISLAFTVSGFVSGYFEKWFGAIAPASDLFTKFVYGVGTTSSIAGFSLKLASEYENVQNAKIEKDLKNISTEITSLRYNLDANLEDLTKGYQDLSHNINLIEASQPG